MRVGDVGKQGKGNVLCRVSCFWCMRPLKHWQILAKRPGLATVAPPIICWIVEPLVRWCSGTRRSNNCVYLLLPWLYLEFVQPSLDGPTSNGGSDSWSSFTLYVWFISVVTLSSQLQYISPHQSQSTQLRARTEDLSKWPALLFSWLWLYSLLAREESFKTKIFCKNISCAFSCS